MFKRAMRAHRVHKRLGAPKPTEAESSVTVAASQPAPPADRSPGAALPLAVTDAPPGDLTAALGAINAALSGSEDLIIRRFRAGGRPAALVYLNGMVDKKLLGDEIVRPLLTADLSEANDVLAKIDEWIISIVSTKRVTTLAEALRGALEGTAALLIDGAPGGLLLGAQSWEHRTVSEPTSEVGVRGPRESFTENLTTNISLLRRRIRDASLVTEQMQIGVRTVTNVQIVYISALIDESLVAEVRARLSRIDTDAILDSGYVEQLIEDAPSSLFATVGYSERPDVVTARLLEGRVAIAVDGSPLVLTVPYLFLEGFNVAEDYYVRPWLASATRLIRFLALFITWLAPATYVSVVNFHPELIPAPLLVSLSSSAQFLPLPLVVEMAILIIAFDIIREAGIRLPKAVGQAVSIAGVIIVGDTAVRAGLADPASVIVTAASAIAAFTIEPLNDARYYVRVFLLVMASIVGFVGVTLGLFTVLIHLASLRSFGVAYLGTFAPLPRSLVQDSLVRSPIWMMRRRPSFSARDSVRQGVRQRPRPPGEGGSEPAVRDVRR